MRKICSVSKKPSYGRPGAKSSFRSRPPLAADRSGADVTVTMEMAPTSEAELMSVKHLSVWPVIPDACSPMDHLPAAGHTPMNTAIVNDVPFLSPTIPASLLTRKLQGEPTGSLRAICIARWRAAHVTVQLWH